MSSSHPSGYPKKSGIGFITISEVTDVTKVNHTIPGIGMKYPCHIVFPSCVSSLMLYVLAAFTRPGGLPERYRPRFPFWCKMIRPHYTQLRYILWIIYNKLIRQQARCYYRIHYLSIYMYTTHYLVFCYIHSSSSQGRKQINQTTSKMLLPYSLFIYYLSKFL